MDRPLAESAEVRTTGWLDRVERLGNALPDPLLLFVGMILVLALLSAVGAAAGWSAVNPVTGEVLVARNLFGEELLRRFLTEFPKTFASFPPLGIALAIVMGAGVADHSGMLNALVRGGLQRVPRRMLTFSVFLFGMMTTHAQDAGFVVYVPLGAVIFLAMGRHPVLGIVTAFTGVASGLAGNLLPSVVDVLTLSITQVGARIIAPEWVMNPLGYWYFTIAVALTYSTVAAIVIERWVAPRLGDWTGSTEAPGAEMGLSADERRGLRRAGAALLALVALVLLMSFWPGWSPLIDRSADGTDRIRPLFGSIVALVFLLFAATGWAYGSATGSIRSYRDVIQMMQKGLEPMLPYLVLVLFAAQFVAMFGWSNLGPITAIRGAELLQRMGMPPALLLPILATLTAWLDFLIASQSAKWTVMSPIVVPMFMLLGISPEMTTAAYRIGDAVTNMISPLNPYFVLTLQFCQRWMPEMRIGALLSLTLPVAIGLYVAGMVLIALWVMFELPLGPGAGVRFVLPGG